MAAFTLSGFADEISIDFDQQLDGLKNLGIQYIELRMINGKSVIKYTLEEARVFKNRLDAAGIRVSALGSPIGKVSITSDFDEYLPVYRHALDLADVFETPYIRMFSFYIPADGTREQYRAEVLRRLRVFVTLAEARGITLLHENESGIYGENAECCADLFRSIPSKRFRAVFDPANFVAAGVEVYPYAYNVLKEHIHYLHIKDAIRTSDKHEVKPAGQGNGKIAEVLQALRNDNFSGFLSIEPHLHDVYTQMDVFKAYKADGGDYIGDGFPDFKRAYEALAAILEEVTQ